MSYRHKPEFECKGMDTLQIGDIITPNLTNNQLIYPLNLVQSGTGSWQRVGRVIQLKSVSLYGHIRFLLEPLSGVNITTGYVRMALVYDKRPSGVIPNFNDIFGATSQTGLENVYLYSPLRYDNMERFTLLKDFTVYPTWCPTVGDLTKPAAITHTNYEVHCELPDLQTVFSGQSVTMTISDISNGALYLVVRRPAMGNSSCTIEGQVRLFYYDK